MGFPEIGLEAIFKNAAFNRAVSGYMHDLSRMGLATDTTALSIGKRYEAMGGTLWRVLGATGVAVAGMAAAAGAALFAFSADSTKTAISVESAFAGVIKTTDGLTSDFGVLNEAGKDLKQGFKDLSEEVPLTVEELMRIGELGGQLGIAKEGLLDFTSVIADIGVATDLTTEEAAMGFAQLMNIMGTAESDVSRLGSTIVDLGNNFATTEPQILAFGHRIAGAGKIAGLTEADVLGIGTAMASVGVEAEAGGTAVQKVLIAMNTASLGVSTSIVDNSAGIIKAEQKVVEKTEKLAIARQRLAEVTDKTAISTRMTREKAVRDLEASIAGEQAALQGLQQTHGMTAEAAAEDLKMFAATAGMTAKEFSALWEQDAGQAFALFVQGLGEQGDEAINTLKDLGLSDQRLVRSFLSLANAGDLVTDAMDRAGGAWQENTALTIEAQQRYATTASQLGLLRNSWRNLKDDIGPLLLPAFGGFIELASDLVKTHGPALVGFFENTITPAIVAVGEALKQIVAGDIGGALTTLFGGDVATQILDIAGGIRDLIGQISAFVSEHAEGFKAAFMTIGALLGGSMIYAAIVAIAGALGGMLLPIIAIGAAVGVLVQAWTDDWGGIRTTLTAFWYETAQPILQTIVEWLSVNVPLAIATLSRFWTETLLPAVRSVWDYLSQIFVPGVKDVSSNVLGGLQSAVDAVSGVWTDVFLPAVQGVWKFLSQTVAPFLKAFFEVGLAIGQAQVRLLSESWGLVLKPTLEAVWQVLDMLLGPVLSWYADTLLAAVGRSVEGITTVWNELLRRFRVSYEFLRDALGPILEWLRDRVLLGLETGFAKVRDAIGWVTDKLRALRDGLNNLHLPAWLTPGSPTPFELGLLGINDALRTLTTTRLPDLQVGLQVDRGQLAALLGGTHSERFGGQVSIPSSGGGGGAREYHLHINSSAPTESVVSDFHMMEAFA